MNYRIGIAKIIVRARIGYCGIIWLKLYSFRCYFGFSAFSHSLRFSCFEQVVTIQALYIIFSFFINFSLFS